MRSTTPLSPDTTPGSSGKPTNFVIEDNNSFKGTYINDQRITRQALHDGDNILVGKHIITFQAEPEKDVAPASTFIQKPAVPTLESTRMLDTKKARELMAQAIAKPAPAAASPGATASFSMEAAPPPPPPGKRRLGVLSVISGKTDMSRYVLTGKLTVIGKFYMASIRAEGVLTV